MGNTAESRAVFSMIRRYAPQYNIQEGGGNLCAENNR